MARVYTPLPDHSQRIRSRLEATREKLELLIRRSYQLAGNENAESFAQVRVLAGEVRSEIDRLDAIVMEALVP